MRDEIHVPVFNISNKCQFFDVDVLVDCMQFSIAFNG